MLPGCEKISRIAFYFVDQVNIFTSEQKELIPNEAKNEISNKNKMIKFVSMHSDRSINNGYFLATSIRSEILFKTNDCDKSSIKVGVKIIYPDYFYMDEFSCLLKDKVSCVNGFFKEKVGKQIEDYLFNPTKPAIQ